ALVRDVRRVARDLHDALRLRVHVDVDLAADAAERARRLDLREAALVARGRAVEELLVDGARRARREAAAAELALGVEPRPLPRRDDARVRPAPLERER